MDKELEADINIKDMTLTAREEFRAEWQEYFQDKDDNEGAYKILWAGGARRYHNKDVAVEVFNMLKGKRSLSYGVNLLRYKAE